MQRFIITPETIDNHRQSYIEQLTEAFLVKINERLKRGYLSIIFAMEDFDVAHPEDVIIKVRERLHLAQWNTKLIETNIPNYIYDIEGRHKVGSNHQIQLILTPKKGDDYV